MHGVLEYYTIFFTMSIFYAASRIAYIEKKFCLLRIQLV